MHSAYLIPISVCILLQEFQRNQINSVLNQASCIIWQTELSTLAGKILDITEGQKNVSYLCVLLLLEMPFADQEILLYTRPEALFSFILNIKCKCSNNCYYNPLSL